MFIWRWFKAVGRWFDYVILGPRQANKVATDMGLIDRCWYKLYRRSIHKEALVIHEDCGTRLRIAMRRSDYSVVKYCYKCREIIASGLTMGAIRR